MPGKSTLDLNQCHFGDLSYDFRPIRDGLQPGSAMPPIGTDHEWDYRLRTFSFGCTPQTWAANRRESTINPKHSDDKRLPPSHNSLESK